MSLLLCVLSIDFGGGGGGSTAYKRKLNGIPMPVGLIIIYDHIYIGRRKKSGFSFALVVHLFHALFSSNPPYFNANKEVAGQAKQREKIPPKQQFSEINKQEK